MRSMIIAAAFSLFAGTAFAACPDTSAGVDTGTTAGIEKDGSLAPLQTPEAGTQPVVKDGKTMPLADHEGGGDKNLATSQQDVEAQQQGDLAAAAKADDCKE